MEQSVEFSRLFPVDKIRGYDEEEHIEATEEEMEALAKRLDIVALKNLQARVYLQRIHSGEMVEVKGRFSATVVQHCGVTLEPFESEVGEEFTAYFARPDTLPNSEEIAIEDDASPEPITANGEIDLGELTAQHLSLAIDPFPRKPGVVFEIPPEVAPKQANPFAVLAEYRDKKNKEKPKG